MSAIYNLIPLPRHDGYWLVRDLFGVPLSPRLRPSPDHPTSNVIYGYFLVVVAGVGALPLLVFGAHAYHRLGGAAEVGDLMRLAAGAALVLIAGCSVALRIRAAFRNPNCP